MPAGCADIPGVIVHGRYDLCTPIETPGTCTRRGRRRTIRIVPDSGHAMTEPGIIHELVTATEGFKPVAGSRS